MVDEKKSTYRIGNKVLIQARDVEIFSFLDRVGYATVAQIAQFIGGGDEKSQAAVLRRLYVLRRFGYVKTFSTHMGIYFALDFKGRGNNVIISTIKLDQLKHHDFLTELFFIAHEAGSRIVSERECIAQFKVVGKKGKVPDMVINDWIIEYERTSKSVADSRDVVSYWVHQCNKQLCVIYANNEIKARYEAFLARGVVLLSKDDYKSILGALSGQESSFLNKNEPTIIKTAREMTIDDHNVTNNQGNSPESIFAKMKAFANK